MSKGVALFVLCGSVLMGCGSEDSVSLSGAIREASLDVEQQAIGTFVSGEFELFVELGAHGSGPVTIDGITFVLLDKETQAELIAPLDATTADATFPFDLGTGKKRSLTYTIVSQDPIATNAHDTLCSSSPIVAGTVSHSLNGGSTTVIRSTAITPSGCE